jgi:hypothetical protein
MQYRRPWDLLYQALELQRGRSGWRWCTSEMTAGSTSGGARRARYSGRDSGASPDGGAQASASDRFGKMMQQWHDQGLSAVGHGCSAYAAAMVVEATQGEGRQWHGGLADLGLTGTAAKSRRHSPSVMLGSSPPLSCHAARCLQVCVTYPILLVGCAIWHLSVNAGATALEGGLHGRLSGEQCGGGGGSFLRPCGWQGEDIGGLCCWRCFGSGGPGSCVAGQPWRQRVWVEDGE